MRTTTTGLSIKHSWGLGEERREGRVTRGIYHAVLKPFFFLFLFTSDAEPRFCFQFVPDFTPSFMFHGSLWQYYQNALAQWIHPPARWQCPHVLNAPARPLELPSQQWRNAFSACMRLYGIKRDTAFSGFCFKVLLVNLLYRSHITEWINQRVLIHWSISTIHDKYVGFFKD